MRPRRFVFMLAWCVGISANTTAPVLSTSSVSIECCMLWDSLSAYVQTHSGIDRSACEPLDCVETGQVNIFMRQTNAVLAQKMHFEGTALILPIPSSEDMKRLLVWAFIGRHFTSTLQKEVQGEYFFEFNVASRTMTLRKIQCEFEKPLYVCMIVMTIIVLIFIMSSGLLKQNMDALEIQATLPQSSHDKTTSATPISLRYRSVPQVL